MSYISEIFNRPDIQHIREFLLDVVECVEGNSKSYKEWIEEARKPALDFIQQKYPKMSE